MYFAATFVHDLIEYARVKEMQSEHLAPKDDKYVDYEVMVKTLLELCHQLGDINLGMHVGERISLRVTAPVDSIMLNSKTLEDSINNAIAYSKLISDALECSLIKTPEHYAVTYQENPNWHVHQELARKQIIDLALLSNVKSLAAYTRHQYYPLCINFSYDKPKSLNEYYRLFNCSLKFNQPRTEIIYDRQIIERHNRNVKLGLLENLKEKVAVEIKSLKPENRLVHELKRCILSNKPTRIPIGEAAEQLNVSVRTLQRKLSEMNTTFKQVEYELQLRLARTYLEENRKSIEEISYLLGFSEASAFIRFFKSITYKTPKEYRMSRAGLST